ncbi:MAG: WbqC family protein [Muribaculaceae bacterium]|nr:WbqC family protein [Muribaculaceae bacterium]
MGTHPEISESRPREMGISPEILPLMPSADWFGSLLMRVGHGEDIKEAILSANTGLNPKEYGRFRLLGSRERELVCSVALEGGGRQLRNLESFRSLRLSGHGEWQRMHLGSMESVLGRMPYYRHIEERIGSIYEEAKEGTLLIDFNTAIFQSLYSFLMKNIGSDELKGFYGNRLLQERGKEIAGRIRGEISVLEAISQYGRDTLLGLLVRGIPSKQL